MYPVPKTNKPTASHLLRERRLLPLQLLAPSLGGFHIPSVEIVLGLRLAKVLLLVLDPPVLPERVSHGTSCLIPDVIEFLAAADKLLEI